MIENITLIADNEAANVDSINSRLEKANTNFNSLNSTKADKTTVYTKQETDIKLTEQKNYIDTSKNYTLTHTKLGTVHTLSDLPTGQGIYQCQFIAQADYTEGDTFTGYTAKPTGEETILPDKAFVKGDIVSVLVDTVNKKLGFKIGGSGVNQTLPPQIRSFAVTNGNAQNKLSWLLPVDTSAYEGLVIVKKVGSAPTKLSDGTKISLSKTATSYTDTGLTNDTKYYYRAFPYNIKKQYQTDVVGAVAYGTPKEEFTVTIRYAGDIPSGYNPPTPKIYKDGTTVNLGEAPYKDMSLYLSNWESNDVVISSSNSFVITKDTIITARWRQLSLAEAKIDSDKIIMYKNLANLKGNCLNIGIMSQLVSKSPTSDRSGNVEVRSNLNLTASISYESPNIFKLTNVYQNKVFLIVTLNRGWSGYDDYVCTKLRYGEAIQLDYSYYKTRNIYFVYVYDTEEGVSKTSNDLVDGCVVNYPKKVRGTGYPCLVKHDGRKLIYLTNNTEFSKYIAFNSTDHNGNLYIKNIYTKKIRVYYNIYYNYSDSYKEIEPNASSVCGYSPLIHKIEIIE